jgi:hypothetical protein
LEPSQLLHYRRPSKSIPIDRIPAYDTTKRIERVNALSPFASQIKADLDSIYHDYPICRQTLTGAAATVAVAA